MERPLQRAKNQVDKKLDFSFKISINIRIETIYSSFINPAFIYEVVAFIDRASKSY